MSASVLVICRLCAAISENPYDVFYGDGHHTLAHLIRIYLDININREDKLPSVVCNNCRDKMVSFDTFASNCKRVQKTLIAAHNKNEPILESIDGFLNGDYDSHHPYVSIKEEVVDNVSVKSENFSDHFNDDDQLPIAELCTRKKMKKRKSRNSEYKSLSKLKKLSVACEIEDKLVIKTEIDSHENSLNTHSNNIDEPEKRVKKYKLVKNSFLRFICHICTEEFRNFTALRTHCKRAHKSSPMVKCMCDKFLKTRHSINKHIVKHDISQGLKCEECDKTFESSGALLKHSYIHIPEDQYPHVCSHCAKRFPSASSLNKHEKIHIPIELRYVYPCDMCGVKFVTKGNLKTHVESVHENKRPFICDICGFAFNNNGNLQNHRMVHNVEKLFDCPKCSQSFKTKVNLQRHVKRHSEVTYKCPECPVILKSRTTLRRHMCIHEDTCKYICTYCNKGFKRRKALKSHLNIHTGERPFCCQWCPKTFTNSSNCRIHKKRIHPKELAEYEASVGINQEMKGDAVEKETIICNIDVKKTSDC